MSLVQVIEEEMLEIKNPITFDDIASLKTAKDLLNEAVTLPLLIPEFFVGIREPWKGVLLFGPPGKHSTLSFGFGKPKTTRNESNRSQFIISLSLSLSVSLCLSPNFTKQAQEKPCWRKQLQACPTSPSSIALVLP